MENPPTLGPRIIIAGTSSGVGKTTIATALMANMRSANLTVAPAKVGPDFIDPTYHELAAGVRGRTLDTFLCKDSSIRPTLYQLSKDSDIAVIEGVMGLFDGTLMKRDDTSIDLDPKIPSGSTAEIAALTDTPVLLVLDATAVSSSLAATLEGFVNFSTSVNIAAVIINNLGSESHLTLIKSAMKHIDVEIVGAIPRGAVKAWRSRHLGLIPTIENREEIFQSLTDLSHTIQPYLDQEKILQIARSAPKSTVTNISNPGKTTVANRANIAIATGKAFSFLYPENVAALELAGAKISYFDPISDPGLPSGIEGIYLGGGFPELYAEKLSRNVSLLYQIKNLVQDGLPVWAECGGLMWLADRVGGHKMAGVIPTEIEMTDKLTLGYIKATPVESSCLCDSDQLLYGHEFHYSKSSPAGTGMRFQSRTGEKSSGFLAPNIFASYLHLHLGSQQHLADNFVSSCG